MSEIDVSFAEDYTLATGSAVSWEESTEAAHSAPSVKGWASYDTIESMAEKTTVSEPDARKVNVNLGLATRLKQMLGFTQSAAIDVVPSTSGAAQAQQQSEQVQLAGQEAVQTKPHTIQLDSKNASYLNDAIDEASNWISWLWDKVNPYGSSESTDHHTDDEELLRFNKDGTANPFAERKILLTPEERQRFRTQVKEMNHLMDRMKELLDDDQFELLMMLIVQESMRSRDEAASLVQQQMLNTYKKRMKLNKERVTEAQDYIKAAQSYQWWGQFEEWASTLGLTMAAASVSGTGGWGVVALCYVLGSAFNRWKGNPVESALAKAVAWTSEATLGANRKKVERNCFETVRVGTGLANLLLTFRFSGTHYLGTMMEGAMQLVNVHVKTKCDHSEGRLFELDHKLQKEQKAISGQMKKIGSELEKRIEDQKRNAQLAQQQEEISRAFFR